MIKNKKDYLHYYLFSLSFIFLIYNFYNDSGYWFDEWSTLLNSDPEVPINKIYDRINGIGTVGELAPKTYFLVLRFFFSIFGFTAENGRIFSIFFFILSIFTFYLLLKLFINKKNSLFIASILSLNPFMIWMANETRLDTFNIFFCILNIFFFFKCLIKKNFKYILFYITSSVLMLSIHPLTIPIILSQIFYVILKKKINYLIFIILSCIIYFIINYSYITKGLSGELTPGHAKLQLNFFLSFYYNTFFGNKYFGAIYLIIFSLIILNLKKIINEKIILLSVVIIFSTYSLIIIGNLFSLHIAAPRYIEFIVPFTILTILYNIKNIDLEFKNKYIPSKKILIFFIVILNVFITNGNKPVKKPATKEALNIIKSNNIKHIYISPDQYFSIYLKSINYFKINNFILMKNVSTNQEKKILKFAYLCKEKQECYKYFDKYKSYKIIKTFGYEIVLYKSNL